MWPQCFVSLYKHEASTHTSAHAACEIMWRLGEVFAWLVVFSHLLQGACGTGCHHTVNWKQARECCFERSVVSLLTPDDLNYVIQEMKTRNLTSVWTGLQRTILPKWTWTDNSTSFPHSLKEGADTARCAQLNMNLKEIEREVCAARGKGHICEKKGCYSCSDIAGSTCKQIENKCYVYHCDEFSFDKARAACVKEGQDLAIVPNNFSSLLEDQHCRQFWIGLRREDWLSSDGHIAARAVSLWLPGEPMEKGNCSVMHWNGRKFTWRAVACTERHNVICGKHTVQQDLTTAFTWSYTGPSTLHSTKQAPGKNSPGNLVIILSVVGGVAVCVILFLGIFFYRRAKKTKSKRRAAPGEKENDQSYPLLEKRINSKKLRIKLANKLLGLHRRLELWSFLDDLVEMNLDDIYTEMTWKTSDVLYHTDGDAHNEYTDIFMQEKDGQRLTRILVHGEAGVGKTSFVKKILVDWSRALLNNKHRFRLRKESGLENLFSYVIPIFLRDIRKDETLRDLIRRQLEVDDSTAGRLLSEINNKQEKSLLILEGYDELRPDSCSDIVKLIDREMLQDINLMITCRSPYSYYLPRRKGKADIYVELEGFSQTSVELYTYKYFSKKGKETDITKALLNKIESSEDLGEMSKIPAVLLLICILWDYRDELSNTVTGFYNDFAKYMCMRYAKKYLPQEDISYEDVLDKFETKLKKLGKIAFDGLKGEHMNLIFSDQEVRKAIGKDDNILRLGFIRAVGKTCDAQYYSFHHRTVQEFFTAFYIVKCNESERLKLLMSFCSSKHRHQESKQILRFVAGLGDYGIKYHVVEALSGWTEDSTRDKITFLLTYLDENMKVQFELPAVVEIEMSSYHKASTYTRFFKMAADDLVELHIYVKDLKVMCYLKELKAPKLTELSVTLSNELHVLHPRREVLENVQFDVLLQTFPLETLSFRNFEGNSAEEIVVLCKHLDSVQSLKSLDLSSCEFSPESTEKLRNNLPKLVTQKGLNLGDN